MTKMLLGALIAVVGCASAPAPVAPAPMAACAAGGAIVFEIDANVAGAVASSQKVDEAGYWTVSADGKQTSGCLTPDERKTVMADVAAPFVTVPIGGARCHVMRRDFTSELVSGKHVWDDQSCPSERLDDASQKRLDELVAILGAATKRS